MTRRRVITRPAPDGWEALWRIEDGTLVVYLAPELDDIARQQFVQEARRTTGGKQRRVAAPLIAAMDAAQGVHRATRQHTVATLTTGAAVTGLAAMFILPAVLPTTHAPTSHPHGTPPAAAQPTPTHDGPMKPPTQPTTQPVSRTVPPSPTVSPSTPLPRTPTYIPVSPPAAGPRLSPPIVRRVQPVTGPLPVPLPPHRPPPLPMPLPRPQPAACMLTVPLIHAGVLCSQALIMRSP